MVSGKHNQEVHGRGGVCTVCGKIRASKESKYRKRSGFEKELVGKDIGMNKIRILTLVTILITIFLWLGFFLGYRYGVASEQLRYLEIKKFF